ncbi:DUF3086 domain-containing protein [Geminocystis sp. CENA526]|uniref:DUF3086 domain-containing protein n=1 Tax=Geminocystis sp. CENA526 TaxID=1355871 RepID=UPI003D6FBC8D
MSDIKKESLEKNTELDYFDDDDLWQMQSEKTTKSETSRDSIEPPNFVMESEEELPKNNITSDELAEDNDSMEEELNILSLEDIGIDDNGNKESKPIIENKIEENKPQNIENIVLENQDLSTEKIDKIEAKNQDLTTEMELINKPDDDLQKFQENIKININLLVQEGLKELEQKKQNLELEIQKLERRKEKIDREMKTTFSGVSQDLAIRVQGFKDYLVGSLQDLAAAAEQLELVNNNPQSWEENPKTTATQENNNPNPSFVEKNFKEEMRQIRGLLDQYRTRPDYYGAPWQLRRTFEPVHAQRVGEWFFNQGGRGSLRSMSSRLQNILIASAIMSILYQLYGDRTRTLILSDTPERLGEWRRGLQDCLGISRSDFGPNRGVVLFETPEALIQKGDRIIEEKDLPLVIIDQSDDKVSLSLLKFPLWLAFAPETTSQSSNYYY